MTDSILFLRDRAEGCRQCVSRLNPCADPGDHTKNLLLDHAKQYDAAADEIDRLRGDVQRIFDMGYRAAGGTIVPILNLEIDTALSEDKGHAD